MPTNQKETAEFIRTMLSELAAMARGAKLDSLSYILDVAQHEAGQAESAAAGSAARPALQRSGERKSKRPRKRAA